MLLYGTYCTQPACFSSSASYVYETDSYYVGLYCYLHELCSVKTMKILLFRVHASGLSSLIPLVLSSSFTNLSRPMILSTFFLLLFIISIHPTSAFVQRPSIDPLNNNRFAGRVQTQKVNNSRKLVIMPAKRSEASEGEKPFLSTVLFIECGTLFFLDVGLT